MKRGFAPTPPIPTIIDLPVEEPIIKISTPLAQDPPRISSKTTEVVSHPTRDRSFQINKQTKGAATQQSGCPLSQDKFLLRRSMSRTSTPIAPQRQKPENRRSSCQRLSSTLPNPNNALSGLGQEIFECPHKGHTPNNGRMVFNHIGHISF